jgi:hypothetical protein
MSTRKSWPLRSGRVPRVNEDCIMISLSPLLPNTHIYQSVIYKNLPGVIGGESEYSRLRPSVCNILPLAFPLPLTRADRHSCLPVSWVFNGELTRIAERLARPKRLGGKNVGRHG